jgi:hypothetical protein
MTDKTTLIDLIDRLTKDGCKHDSCCFYCQGEMPFAPIGTWPEPDFDHDESCPYAEARKIIIDNE